MSEIKQRVFVVVMDAPAFQGFDEGDLTVATLKGAIWDLCAHAPPEAIRVVEIDMEPPA